MKKPVSLNGWAFWARKATQIPSKSNKVGWFRDERKQQRYVHIQKKISPLNRLKSWSNSSQVNWKITNEIQLSKRYYFILRIASPYRRRESNFIFFKAYSKITPPSSATKGQVQFVQLDFQRRWTRRSFEIDKNQSMRNSDLTLGEILSVSKIHSSFFSSLSKKGIF